MNAAKTALSQLKSLVTGAPESDYVKSRLEMLRTGKSDKGRPLSIDRTLRIVAKLIKAGVKPSDVPAEVQARFAWGNPAAAEPIANFAKEMQVKPADVFLALGIVSKEDRVLPTEPAEGDKKAPKKGK